MIDLLGIESASVSGEPVETPISIAIPIRFVFPTAPTCPRCKEPMALDGRDHTEIADSPMRGKPVTLLALRERRRCRPCKEQVTASSRDVTRRHKLMTRRLVSYVENRATKYTASAVAVEVGLSRDSVAAIGKDLWARIWSAPSHWGTPELLALDNVQCGNSRFQVLFDQGEARPIALIQSWEVAAVLDEIKRLKLNARSVRIFTSDMSKTNIAVGNEFKNALHVADKFHVFDAMNKAVSSVIATRVAELIECGRGGEATALRALKSRLTGKRSLAEKDDPQPTFELPPPIKELDRHDNVQHAYAVRRLLSQFYASRDYAQAKPIFERVLEMCASPAVKSDMSGALAYLQNYRSRIVAYFEALQIMGRDLWAPTTNALERFNSDVQEIWKSGRGYSRDFNMFQLRVLYHRYVFGVHVIECESCGRFEGPADPATVLTRSHQPVGAAELRWCAECLLIRQNQANLA